MVIKRVVAIDAIKQERVFGQHRLLKCLLQVIQVMFERPSYYQVFLSAPQRGLLVLQKVGPALPVDPEEFRPRRQPLPEREAVHVEVAELGNVGGAWKEG